MCDLLADAFCSMMKGGNVGKQIIKISEWSKWLQLFSSGGGQPRRLSITMSLWRLSSSDSTWFSLCHNLADRHYKKSKDSNTNWTLARQPGPPCKTCRFLSKRHSRGRWESNSCHWHVHNRCPLLCRSPVQSWSWRTLRVVWAFWLWLLK